LSAQRDGHETLCVTFRHDRVEQPASSLFHLVTGIVLVETNAPGVSQLPRECTRESPNG
jgi:hypothetical protein